MPASSPRRVAHGGSYFESSDWWTQPRHFNLLGELRELGASVRVGHAAGNLGHLGPGDTLVVSSAIRPDNPELAEAARRGMRVVHRAAALASVMAGRRVIAVAGTHGKTTTTSMLTTVLRECGADPGYVIGGILTETGLGAEDGSGLDFVAEADESDGSFLLLSPDLAIITNVEADHLDNWGTEEAYRAAFAEFVDRIDPERGFAAVVGDMEQAELADHRRAQILQDKALVAVVGPDIAQYRHHVTGSGNVRKPFTILVVGIGNDALDVLHHRKAERVGIKARKARIVEVGLKHHIGVRLQEFQKIAVGNPALLVQPGHDAVMHVGRGAFVHDLGLTLGIKILRDVPHDPEQLALPGTNGERFGIRPGAGGSGGEFAGGGSESVFAGGRAVPAEFIVERGSGGVPVPASAFSARGPDTDVLLLAGCVCSVGGAVAGLGGVATIQPHREFL